MHFLFFLFIVMNAQAKVVFIIFKANLEMNKETFTKELVCLLEKAARPTDVAEFEQHVESFFIAGAARIDLIAETMDLDNDIGGYNFDIPLLDQTETAIKNASETKGKRLQLAVLNSNPTDNNNLIIN